MATHERLTNALGENGIIAVLRGVDRERIVPVARAIHDGGVRGIEITADDDHVGEKITAVSDALASTDAIVGAGTVLEETTAQDVIDAGAEFVFAPNVDPDVVEACNRNGVVSGPGVMTPTEAVTAVDAGADVLKLFPATTVGPEHIGALQGPLGDLPIVPTGGISTENITEFFDAGAVAVGIGSAIVDYRAIEKNEMERVRETARTFVDTVETSQ